YVAVDGRGSRVGVGGTAGQVGDLTQAEAPLAGLRPGAVIADKGHDSDRFVAAGQAAGAGGASRPLAAARGRGVTTGTPTKGANRPGASSAKTKRTGATGRPTAKRAP